MALFRYEALSTAGGSQRGTIDAGTLSEARASLREQGLFAQRLVPAIESLNEKQAVSPLSQKGSALDWSGKRLDMLSLFSRHMALLLKSGLPLAQALTVLQDQIESNHFREVIADITVRVKDGAALDEALAMHRQWFPDLMVCVSRAGAASGHLPEILTATAAYYTRQKRLRTRVVSALAYPALMMLIGTFVVAFLMSYVVPKVTAVLLEEKRALPWPTEVLMSISGFIVHGWPMILGGIAATVTLVQLALRTERGRYALDGLKLSLPVIGELFRKQAVARWADTMSSLVASGIPVVQALATVKNVLENRLLTDDISTIEKAVTSGTDLSEALKKSRHLPKAVGFIVGVGEETGELARVLREVADSYNEEVETVASRLTDLINPILIVVLGLVVGFIVSAILLPITDFSQIQ